MIQNTISQYVRTLFDESRDGWLTIGMDQERFDYEVVQLQAPAAVQDHEARCLAEEFVLYHSLKQ